MYRQAVAFRFVQIPPGNKKTTPMGWFSYWRSSRDLNPGNTSMSYEISSRSRYTDFEGKRRKITDDVRA